MINILKIRFAKFMKILLCWQFNEYEINIEINTDYWIIVLYDSFF